MNTERPILFSGEMIRRILAGEKTMTRRVVKLPSQRMEYTPWEHPQFGTITSWSDKRGGVNVYCPYGKPGSRLWVRETWGLVPLVEGDDERSAVRCQADGDCPSVARWRPSIHMPRKYSRITLEVCSVRVERVQEISEADAIAEGIRKYLYGEEYGEKYISVGYGTQNLALGCMPNTASGAFARLWDSINEARGFGWDVNPWCWVVEFRRVTP